MIRQNRIIRRQLDAYRRGEYEDQLRIIEGFRVNGSEPAEYLFFRGSTLLELGQLEEAEKCLRRSLAFDQPAIFKALTEDELGLVLLEQERYDDAISAFENALVNAPGRGGPHRGVASALLRQDRQAGDALRRARTAVELDEAARKSAREDLDLNLAESLAIFAWATAIYGGDELRVDELLARAFTLCPPTTRPIRAEIHYHAARAYSALGKLGERETELDRAAEVDPKGNFGRLAAAERLKTVKA
jgi:tetratricopeptide (TPR) repeat protein